MGILGSQLCLLWVEIRGLFFLRTNSNFRSFVSVPIVVILSVEEMCYIINHASIKCVVSSLEQSYKFVEAHKKCPSLKSLVLMTIEDPNFESELQKMRETNPEFQIFTFREVLEDGCASFREDKEPRQGLGHT